MPTDPTLEIERGLLAAGNGVVVGVDEVGRGAIAGPVVVGVSVLCEDSEFPAGLRDSKLISASKRENLMEPIDDWVEGIAAGEASAAEIDEQGKWLTLHFNDERTAGMHLSLSPVRKKLRELLAKAVLGRVKL
jgi:ribonuclease HII